MNNYITSHGIQVDADLYQFINEEAIPGTGVKPSTFWSGFADIINDLTPTNRALLAKRDELQARIDGWHQEHRGQPHDAPAYKAFLEEIGYLVPEGEAFSVTTGNVDPEIASIAGPQLVVPVSNARFAIKAANARWGSLLDTLCGSDVISEQNGCERSIDFNPTRATPVMDYGMARMDEIAPLTSGSHLQVTDYAIVDGQLKVNGGSGELQDPSQFVGCLGDPAKPSSVLLKHHGLHVEILIDPEHPMGGFHQAGVSNIYIEAAITAIQDCEDSVAAVDAEDKIGVYANWLGLMKGDLKARIPTSGRMVERSLNPDREFKTPDGGTLVLPGRALMLVRNVGHLMTNPAMLDAEGDEVFEGIMDAMITALIALHDLKGNSSVRNSRTGSMYIVKPKMHGPEEVAYAVDLFARVEQVLGMAPKTMKIGIMDEERRTTVNLKECIREAQDRVIFINTGFLDRTGDEIHTSMEAGPMVRKADMKKEPWILAYEDWNVDIGLECGLPGHAQIGKGMWPIPDQMKAMMDSKRAHLEAGANCAWVPSPTAATLHALHYHEIDVFARQRELASRPRARLDDILTIPVAAEPDWKPEEIQAELDNNCQGILGYVVRWVDQGVGCSKVPDINDVGLMEDRATCRISSQHVANWMYHGIVSEVQVVESLRRMASVVDRQNQYDRGYFAMAPRFNGKAFEAAKDLIFHGRETPNGYTEPPLHQRRLELKTAHRADLEQACA